MFAGLRLGYAVAHEEVIKNMNKIMVHQIYSPPSLSQMMMIAPLSSRHNWMAKVRAHYQLLRDLFLDNLNISVYKPEGTYFIFFEVSRYLKNRSYDDLIRGIFARGVSVAPGADFGKAYTNFIRLCFTGETPDRLAVAVEKLNKYFEEINAKDQL
jgi:aspartate/methionine/tyrosine aminotransferase